MYCDPVEEFFFSISIQYTFGVVQFLSGGHITMSPWLKIFVPPIGMDISRSRTRSLFIRR